MAESAVPAPKIPHLLLVVTNSWYEKYKQPQIAPRFVKSFSQCHIICSIFGMSAMGWPGLGSYLFGV